MGLVMRRLVVAVALIGFANGALAADYDTDFPTLRGSTPYIPAPPRYMNWEGVYGGGQVGYGATFMDFSKTRISAFDPNYAFTAPFGSVMNWASPGTDNARGATYGGFIGYNWQFDDLVIGFEANYNHTNLLGSSTFTRCYDAVNTSCASAITLGDGNSYNAVVTATSSMRISDYGTARLRAGWANDNWLPYAMVGLAVGRVEISKYATATGTPVNPPGTGTPFTRTEGTVNSPMLAWGYSAGLGVDYLLLPNVFVRAEYEFVSFVLVSDVRSQIHNGRLGLGVKF
jgi:opacity protein-like surface antigen